VTSDTSQAQGMADPIVDELKNAGASRAPTSEPPAAAA
jgi:hypothetical protein